MAKIFTKEENQAWSHNLPGKMTSACLVLRDDNKVLMVKAGYKKEWTFPSGIVDDKESPKEAALRETREEIGTSIAEDKAQLLTVIYTASKEGDRDRFNFAFITDVSADDITPTVPNEEIEQAAWVKLDEIAERSGHKGSYTAFQKILLEQSNHEPYVEVR